MGPTGRPRRSAAVHHGTNGWSRQKRRPDDEFDSGAEDEDSEPDFGDDEEEDHVPDDTDVDEEEFEDDDSLGDVEELDGQPRRLVVKFPIHVRFEDSTGRCIRVSPQSARPDTTRLAAPTASRETASRASTSDPLGSEGRSSPPSPVRTAEEISVAIKTGTRTPEASVDATGTAIDLAAPGGVALAFRGSPEKPQHVPRHVDVGFAE